MAQQPHEFPPVACAQAAEHLLLDRLRAFVRGSDDGLASACQARLEDARADRVRRPLDQAASLRLATIALIACAVKEPR